MTQRFGERAMFAVEVGGGVVAQRAHSRADDETDFREQFWLMHWGETVDNVASYAHLDGDLVFGFWRPTHPFAEDLSSIFVTRIPPDEFAAILDGAADLLDGGLLLPAPDASP